MSFLGRFIEAFRGSVVALFSTGARSAPRALTIEQEELCNAIIDCNATHIARGQILHVMKDRNGRISKIRRDSEYTKLFKRPNPMMTATDFKMAMAWQLQITNTAFAWIKWDAHMHPVEVWPLVYLQFEIHELANESGYAVVIYDTDGSRMTVRMEDLICVRRMYDGSGYAGRSNAPVEQSIEMVQALDEGLKQALQISNKLHGLLKQKNAMLLSDSTKTQDSFAKRLRSAIDEGHGVVSLDSTEDYVPLSVSAWSVNAAQAKQIYDRLFTYWRTPQEVVNNTASEQTMQNYLDSIVEPIWEELGEAITQACFTRREQDFGNEIIVYGGVAMGASWQTKLNIINSVKETGDLTPNERREILGYEPVEGGDERLVSLNYIKASDQTKYQTGEKGDSKDGGSGKAEESNG